MNISTYYLTPQERVSIAQERISARAQERKSSAMLLRSYLGENEVEVEEAKPQQNDSTISRIGQTLGDFYGNLAAGVIKGLEGIYDLGATIVGGIGGIFDKDFQDRVKEHIEYDFTADKITNPMMEGLKGSYLNDASGQVQSIVRGVASGVGQMLPSVAVTIATGGAGASTMVSNIAGLATFGVGAAGIGTEEAFKEGADYWEGAGYGILSGAIEVAIEKISGGLGKQFFGAGITDNIVKNIAAKATKNAAVQKGVKLLLEAGGEAAEEWTSELLNPYLKRMTYDSDAELSTREQRLEAALIGGLTSLAFQGSVGQIGKHTQNATEELQNIETLEKKENKLWGDDKLTEEKITEIEASRNESVQTLSKELQKMGSKRRAKFIADFKIDSLVNEDGTVKPITTDSEIVGNIVEENGENAQNGLASPQTYNRQAYSPALYGKESRLAFKPTATTLNADEIKAKQTFAKLNKGRKNAQIVFADDLGVNSKGKVINGEYKNGILYISRKANALKEVVIHELTHFGRGTKAYNKYVAWIMKNTNTELLDELTKETATTYGIELDELKSQVERFGEMSIEEMQDFIGKRQTLVDEVVARYSSEYLFTDEDAISRISKENRGTASKILRWLKNKIELLKTPKTDGERETLKYLQKAESLYSKALESAVGSAGKRNSLDETPVDSEGRKLTPAQQEFFKDSKVRDKDGNLLVVYHATNNYEGKDTWNKEHGWYDTEYTPFTVFKKQYDEQVGHFFGKDVNNAGGYGGRIYETYLNLVKPLIIDCKGSTYGNITHDGQTMDTYDWAVYARKQGYDGVIFNNVRDGVDYGAMQNETDEFVAFRSSQIKLTTNKNPTADPDIRYSIQVDGKEVQVGVEKKKNLVALHNLFESKLLKTLKLGGFPMPSIAVTKATLPHDGYGGITVVFGKDTIAPEANPSNKVYSGDAWTPTVPQKEMLLGDSIKESIRSLMESVKGIGEVMSSDVRRFFEEYKSNSGEYIITENQLDDIGHRAHKNNGMLAAYLTAQKKPVEMKYRERSFEITGFNAISDALLKKFCDEVGEERIAETSEGGYAEEKAFVEENLDKIKEVLRAAEKEYLDTLEGKPSRLAEVLIKNRQEKIDNLEEYQARSFLNMVRDNYLKTRGTQKYDEWATFDAMQNQVSIEEIGRWATEIIEKHIEAEGLDSGTEIFTRSGERRSYKQRHNPYTLDGILRSMKSQTQIGGGFIATDGEIAARLSKSFKSIKDIKDASERLQLATDEDYTKMRELGDSLLDEISLEMAGGSWSYVDNAREVIGECADKGYRSASQILGYLNREYKSFYKFSERTAEQIAVLFDMLSNYPTTYFEAKPQRAVGFEEIKTVLVPKNSSAELFDALKEKNIDYIVYDDSVEGERSRIIQDMDDVMFSLSPSHRANRTQARKYTQNDAKKALKGILDQLYIVKSDESGTLTGKSRKEVLAMLYKSLNEREPGHRGEGAIEIAEFILNNAMIESVYEDYASYDDIHCVEQLKYYFHKVKMTPELKAEIKYHFDTRAGSVIALWGAKSAEDAFGADVIAQELEPEGITFDSTNDYSIFIEMVEMYEKSRDALKKKAAEKLEKVISKEERKELRAAIIRDVLTAYDKYGSETAVYKQIQKYERRIAELKQLLDESKDYNRLTNSALATAKKLSELGKREFTAASVLNDKRFKKLTAALGKINWRSEMIVSTTRDIVIKFGDEFYNKENADFIGDAFDEQIIECLDFLRESKAELVKKKREGKSLSKAELYCVDLVLKGAYHIFSTYDTILRDGKRESATEWATRGVGIVQKYKNSRGDLKVLAGISRKGGNFIKQAVDPITVMRWADNFYTENGKRAGVMTELTQEIRLAETTTKNKIIDLLDPMVVYFKKTKGYKKRYTTTEVEIAGKKIPLGVAISLSLMAKQNDVWSYENKDGIKVPTGLSTDGFGYRDKNYEIVRVGTITKQDVIAMEKQFTAEDMAYREMVKIFFKETGEMLRETDKIRKGYTTVTNENYFPTHRYRVEMAKDIADTPARFQNLQTGSQPGFLEERKPAAKGLFDIGDVWSECQQHALGSSMYSYMAIPLENLARVYNKNIAAPGDPILTMKNAIAENVWSGFDKYIADFFGDLNGKGDTRGYGSKVLEKLMSGYAKFQLGANPKTVLGQFSSYPMAFCRLDIKALGYGLRKVNFKQLDKYCPYARVRDYEGAVVRAQSMTDNLGAVGDFLTKPIQKVDRTTCGLIFNACKWQVQKEQGLKIGTEENLVAAGKLAEEVIRDTQSNSTIAEKSGLMRNKNGIVRWFTMFTADSMKQLSRLVESIGEYNALKRRIKAGEKGLENSLKALQKKVAKTSTAVLVSNMMFVLIGQLFKWLYDKDREDKNGNEISFIQDVALNFGGQIAGLLPVVRDVYGYFVDGYDINGFLYGTINDVLGATDDIVEVFSKLIKGEATDTPDFMGPLKTSINAFGQIFGVPTRNIYNVVYGLTKRFSPETAYKINNVFYESNFKGDLTKAIEEGDSELAQTIVSLMMKEDGIVSDSKVQAKIVDLYSKGYSVLPKSVNDSITYNGEEYSLTNKQSARFKEVYGQATEKVSSLFDDNQFASLNDECQAKSIKFIYDYYWQLATEDLLGEGLEEKKLLFGEAIPIEKLACIVSYCESLAAEKDNNGKTIAGTRKNQVVAFINRQRGITSAQKYLIMSYLGYKVTTGESVIRSAVRRLAGLTNSQKTKMLAYCGY